MASRNLERLSHSLRGLNLGFVEALPRHATPALVRSMATESPVPSARRPVLGYTSPQPILHDTSTVADAMEPSTKVQLGLLPSPFLPPALTTLHDFPSLMPTQVLRYDAKSLLLPLRRDILHRAVIFEADSHRKGLASSKTRYEVHGTHRKQRPQKGTGRSRMGTKQSPLLRGGGKTFGPHPRDFATKLPRKMYDMAVRMALSYRYRRGELLLLEDRAELELGRTRLLKGILERLAWGGKENGRTTVLTQSVRGNLWKAFEGCGEMGRAMTIQEVDVKDLLEGARIVVERQALDELLLEHGGEPGTLLLENC